MPKSRLIVECVKCRQALEYSSRMTPSGDTEFSIKPCDCLYQGDSYKNGNDDGYDEGRLYGYESGREDGYEDGWGAGYEEGYIDGRAECE